MRYLFALSLALLLCANLANNKLQAQLFGSHETDATVTSMSASALLFFFLYTVTGGRIVSSIRDFPVFQTQTVLDREQIRTEVAKLTGLIWHTSPYSNEDLFFDPNTNNTLQIKYKRHNRYRIRWLYAYGKRIDPLMVAGAISFERRPREFRHPKRNPLLLKVRDFLLSLDSVNLALQPRQN